MSEYTTLKQEPYDSFTHNDPRLHCDHETTRHSSRTRSERDLYTSSSSSSSSSRRRRRSRSASPPPRTRSPPRTRRGRRGAAQSLQVWTGHSYQKYKDGYIIGIGLQFDHHVKTSLQVAIKSTNRQPSHHAEFLAIILALATLKWKKMDNMNVTIHTNQRATAELMDHGPEQPQEYRDEMMLSRFVYKCIEQWPRSVHLSLGVKPTDVNHMKAAKIRAAAIRKKMDRCGDALPSLPQCLWSTSYGHDLDKHCNWPSQPHPNASFDLVLEKSTTDSTLTSVGSSYDSTSAPKSLPSQVPSSTPPVPSSTVPPPVTNSTTQQSVPSDWLSGIPYPIPFEMAGKLIAQLVAITSPPTPEEIERLASQANPIPMPPLQQQHSYYYPTQPATYMPPSQGYPPVPLYQSTPPPLSIMAAAHHHQPPLTQPAYHQQQLQQQQQQQPVSNGQTHQPLAGPVYHHHQSSPVLYYPTPTPATATATATATAPAPATATTLPQPQQPQQQPQQQYTAGLQYQEQYPLGAQHYPSSQQQPIYSVHDQQRLQTPASSESTITFMKPIEVNGNTTTQSDAPVPLSPTSGHGVTITHPPRLGPVEQQQQQQPGAQQHQEPRQITPPSLSLQQTPPQTPGPPQAK